MMMLSNNNISEVVKSSALHHNQDTNCVKLEPHHFNNTLVLDRMTPLAPEFTPGPFDVICARGRQAKEHCGNVNFRNVIRQSMDKYSSASSKLQKSLIVSEIIEAIRAASPNGGFVKQVASDNRWYEVGDQWAREKVGQSIRDLLHGQYKSSTRAKKIRRRRLSKQLLSQSDVTSSELLANDSAKEDTDDIDAFVRESHYEGHIKLMRDHEEQIASDEDVLQRLVRANCDILKIFREDSMQKQL